jgi:hypothetical protein
LLTKLMWRPGRRAFQRVTPCLRRKDEAEVVERRGR